MKCIDLIAAFELEINKIDDSLNKPVTDDTVYWLNQGVAKFVKERFNGNAPHRTSYEQNEKRTRDLVKLLNTEDLSCVTHEITYYAGTDSHGNKVFETTTIDKITHNDYDEYEYEYPEDMMYVLNEDVVITDNDGNNATDVSVFECTADSFMYRIMNKLTDFHYRYHRARPIRIRTSNGVKLLTDKNYKIEKYTLGYLKAPEEIKTDNPDTDYQDFTNDVWYEIIKIAAQMYLENQSDQRYKTITNEVLTQE